jgi:hypothetical protein
MHQVAASQRESDSVGVKGEGKPGVSQLGMWLLNRSYGHIEVMVENTLRTR